MRTRPRPHPLARASCPRTGRPPSRASHAVLPGITRTVNRESSDTEAVVRMRHASLRGSGSGARVPGLGVRPAQLQTRVGRTVPSLRVASPRGPRFPPLRLFAWLLLTFEKHSH